MRYFAVTSDPNPTESMYGTSDKSRIIVSRSNRTAARIAEPYRSRSDRAAAESADRPPLLQTLYGEFS